jgi:hypothetical protein
VFEGGLTWLTWSPSPLALVTAVRGLCWEVSAFTPAVVVGSKRCVVWTNRTTAMLGIGCGSDRMHGMAWHGMA